MRKVVLAVVLLTSAGAAQALTIHKYDPSTAVVSQQSLSFLVPQFENLPAPEATPLASVPEPSTWALLAAGFGLAGLGLRRRKSVVAPIKG